MQIKRRYFDKRLHEIAIEQIAEEYLEKGYDVAEKQNIDNYQADLIAKKGEETVVIEIKSGKMTPQKKEKIKHLSDYVRMHGNYRFIVTIATPPKEKKLEIDNIESLLLSCVIADLPSELDELSTHTTVDEISEVEIDEIKIDPVISVKGSGIISVELQFGSDREMKKEDGYTSSEKFPFDFDIVLEYTDKHELQVVEVINFKVDTSSFYSE